MSVNIFARLKHKTVFDVDNDISIVRRVMRKKSASHSTNKSTPMPLLRAYILTETFAPVAIFDKLHGDSFEFFIKGLLCMQGKPFKDDTDECKALNIVQQAAGNVDRPYILALFESDRLLFHYTIPVDLMIYLCARFNECDIIDRDLWGVLELGRRKKAVL